MLEAIGVAVSDDAVFATEFAGFVRGAGPCALPAAGREAPTREETERL